MSLHTRIDKMLDELLDVTSVIKYLGQNITFPRLAVAQARISGKAEGRAEGLAKGLAKGVEQGNLEMADLVCDRLIPDLETRANESLRNLGEGFMNTLGTSGVKGVLVRDVKTGLPIKIHPTIKDMFPDDDLSLYYYNNDLLRKNGRLLKQPQTIWSYDADLSVDPDMTQYDWDRTDRCFPRYWTGKLMSTCEKISCCLNLFKTFQQQIFIRYTKNFPTANILQDMQTKRSFHIHDWNRPNSEFVANLRALPPPPPPP